MLTQLELDQIVSALAPIINPRSPPYLLGEQLVIQETNYPLTAAGLVATVPANANRVGLYISTGSSVVTWVSTIFQPTNQGGMAITTQAGSLFLNINDHGTLPQQQLFLSCTTAGSGQQGSYIEMIWKPNY